MEFYLIRENTAHYVLSLASLLGDLSSWEPVREILRPLSCSTCRSHCRCWEGKLTLNCLSSVSADMTGQSRQWFGKYLSTAVNALSDPSELGTAETIRPQRRWDAESNMRADRWAPSVRLPVDGRYLSRPSSRISDGNGDATWREEKKWSSSLSDGGYTNRIFCKDR